MKPLFLTFLVLPIVLGPAPDSIAAEATKPDEAALAFVANKVRPLLEARCFKCHGPEGQRKEKDLGGELLLSSRSAMLTGGETGPAIVPGEPDKSLLIDAINWGDIEMPPKSKLPAGELAILTRWVKMGAPWPEGDAPAVVAKEKFPLAERRASHWAWKPLANPAPPQVSDPSWPRHGLDQFIVAALEQKKLQHAPDADRRTLIRRMTFAITGLPPTPDEVEAFVADKAADDEAIAALADRLLASPHFGERWGRHWLDLMRYAESRGHEFDANSANAWHYRDYVIRALNDDLPYDQFVVEHVAGDLLDTPRLHGDTGANESILATGFWYLGDWVHSPTDIRADEADRVDNQLDVFSRALLGVTVACARCHDHKFDAISTADYYALAGYLQSSAYRQVRFESMEHNREVAGQLWSLREDVAGKLRQAMSGQLQAGIQGTTDYLRAAIATIREKKEATEVAAARKLNAERLTAWVGHLRAAAKQPDDLLHAFAILASRPATDDAAKIAWQSVVDRHRGAATGHAEAWKKSTLLVDFESLPDEAWRQDGYAFGPGPVRVGQLQVSGKADAAKTELALNGGAQQDLTWPGLSLAPGTAKEQGAVGKLNAPGRIVRTPSFTVQEGVYFLVRGTAQLQVVVASHRLIQGPLHGSLIRKFGTGNDLRWEYADLKRYNGERAHIEFVPTAGKPCEILQIASGARPPMPLTPIADAVLWLDSAASETTLAAGLTKKLSEAASTFGKGSLAGAENRKAIAAVVDWALRHPELLAAQDPKTQEATQNALSDYFAKQQEMLAQVQISSATAIATWDGSAEDEYLLIRGSSKNPGEVVPRRFLEALGGAGPKETETGSGRMQLARQMIDTQRNPLLSRVIVNRVWHHLFGRGIVPTVDNFGVLGQPASHPELLDFLATRFVKQGWSLKGLIRELVTSRTYRMSSRPTAADAAQIDPDNIYLHCMPIRRLEGESIRDAILSVSGRLDPKLGGASVPVHLTSFMTGRGRPGGGPLDGNGRRSIYSSIRRNFLSPMMLAFDMPIPFGPVGRRNVSNVPAQPLILMNDPFVVAQAGLWAKRALQQNFDEPSQRIDWMYQIAFNRPARTMEIEAGEAFLTEQATEYGLGDEAWKNDQRVWSDYAHVLWNVKEFIFVQ